jgi:serine protease Do
MVGETVIAIGNPFGLAHTVTTGVLSAANRDIATEEGILLQDFIQVDAPINPGSSGGALLNIDGQLIGVTSAIRRGAEGIGFAVPIDKAMRIVRELIAKGEVAVGWAGFVADDLTPGLRRQLGYEGKEGALVAKVFDDGPAHAAGIRPGDVVTAYDGKKIENRRDLAARIAAAPADARPTLTVHRFGEVMRITVSIAPVTPALADNAARRWLGVEVAPVDRKQVALYRLRTDRGMVVTAVDEGVGLGESGVRPGDVVRRIGRTDTDTRDDYRKGVMDGIGRGGSVVYVQRGTAVYQLTVGR